MLSVIMLSVIMLSVVMLNVIMLSVIAPREEIGLMLLDFPSLSLTQRQNKLECLYPLSLRLRQVSLSSLGAAVAQQSRER
jgi:hypothetical protein